MYHNQCDYKTEQSERNTAKYICEEQNYLMKVIKKNNLNGALNYNSNDYITTVTL